MKCPGTAADPLGLCADDEVSTPATHGVGIGINGKASTGGTSATGAVGPRRILSRIRVGGTVTVLG